jgi:condensin complex subunit 1
VICQLLRSRQVTDIIEAVEFFTSAFQFGVTGAMVGVQQMLILMWSRDQVVRDAVAVAYKKLYLTTENTTPRYVYNLNFCHRQVSKCRVDSLSVK